MKLRRLFALGASAALGASHNATWCMPPKRPPPKREGVDADGRLRYQPQHLRIFGPGFHHDVFWKAKILQMWENSQQFYDDREKKKKMPTVAEFFHKITGFGHQRVSAYKKELDTNDGFLLPPDQRGRQIFMLENEYSDFENWVDNQAVQAMSGYLTVDNLLPKFQEEFGVVISYNVLRAALLRLDFKYQKRERAYVSNKWKPDVLQMLRAHVALVQSKVQFNPITKRWFWVNPTMWSDEAYILSGEMRSMSWVRQRSKYRNIMKGGSKRYCMTGTIFSHNPEGTKGVLKHWNMGTKVEKDDRPFFGKLTSDLILKYFGDYVLHHVGMAQLRPTLFLDNWSVHKRFSEDWGKTSHSQSTWIWKYLEDEGIDKRSAMYKDWSSLYVNLGGEPSTDAIMEYVKNHGIPVRQLERLCQDWHVQLRYLAPYWSPTNPVEFVWARLKQLIRDMDPELPIEIRVQRAWDQIDHDFISACIDRSNRFCLAWNARFRGAGMIMAVGGDPIVSIRKIMFGPVDADDTGIEGSDSSDDDHEPGKFKRYRL
jgi:transposase